MSKRKFSFKDLAKWRRMQLECIDQQLAPNMPFPNTPFPVDWCEFNKMFSSKKNVIVEYQRDDQKYATATQMLMGFYSSIKMAKDNACVGICEYFRGFPGIRKFAKKLSNKNLDDNVVFISSITPFKDYRNRVLECDEWIMNADWSTLHPVYPPDDFSCDGGNILNDIHATKGFSELDVNKELWTSNKTLVGWEDKERKSKWSRKFIITWDNNGRKQLDAMVAKYPDQFLVIPYTKEKRMVDEWYESNETMVDPGFDILLMDGSLDKRKVLLYAATNHLYDFRLFAKVLPDVVEKYITRDELRDLGV